MLAVPLGLVAFVPLFIPLFAASTEIADWPVDAFASAVGSLAVYFLLGVAIGFFNPRLWLVAGVLAWVAVVDALYNLAYAMIDPTYPRGAATLALLVLVAPLLIALGGGYAGRMFAMRRVSRQHASRV